MWLAELLGSCFGGAALIRPDMTRRPEAKNKEIGGGDGAARRATRKKMSHLEGHYSRWRPRLFCGRREGRTPSDGLAHDADVVNLLRADSVMQEVIHERDVSCKAASFTSCSTWAQCSPPFRWIFNELREQVGQIEYDVLKIQRNIIKAEYTY